MLSFLKKLFKRKEVKKIPDQFLLDVRVFPIFSGYTLFFAMRWYTFAYYKHVLMMFRNIAFGNIFKTLFSPITLLVDMYYLTETHVLTNSQMAIKAHNLLCNKD